MRAIGFSREDCISNLRAYSDEIDQLISLFDDGGRIKSGNTASAQALLKGLKAALKHDFERRSTNKGHEEMSEIERAFFFPAIHEASTRIYVKTNSLPSQKWVSELVDAQYSIRYYLNGLQRNEK